MKPFLILLALCAGLWAQRVPPCFQVDTVTSATPGTSINNLPWVASNPGCGGYGWKLQWAVTGFTAVTIQIEGSPDNVNWTALPSSQIASGTNPTTWTGAASPYNIVAFAVNNYMRANMRADLKNLVDIVSQVCFWPRACAHDGVWDVATVPCDDFPHMQVLGGVRIADCGLSPSRRHEIVLPLLPKPFHNLDVGRNAPRSGCIF